MPELLLFLEKITDFDRKDIDKGDTPPEIYQICSSIRTAFCTSFGIKKENNFYIYFQQERVLVKFSGERLKYLGPDERNQAILLKKAFDKLIAGNGLNNNDWIDSTPGIQIRKLTESSSLPSFLHTLNLKKIVLIHQSLSRYDLFFLYHYFDFPKFKHFKRVKRLDESFIIIPLNDNLIIHFLKEIVENFPSMLEFITLARLNNIKTMSDKILFINFQIDQIRNNNDSI